MEQPTHAAPPDGAAFGPGEPAAVALVGGLDRLLDYRAPEGGAAPGDLVLAPLGPRRVLGVVWGPPVGDVAPEKLRPLLGRVDAPPLGAPLRTFLARAADYTLTPLPAMLRLATRAPGLGAPPAARPILLPTGVVPDRMTPARARVLAAFAEYGDLGFAPGELAARAGVSASVVEGLERAGAIRREALARDAPYPALDPAAPARALSPAQAAAAAKLREAVAAGAYSATLLKGVTGSGKTEVYLEAVAACLAAGRQALVLLPEIALSVEFLDRVEARFGARPAEWHSAVGEAARRRAWRAVAEGGARLVVGARSALFLPFRELGLIVVDEEHDSSYKQEDGALYNARDMAVLRASIEGAAVVLASATPSLETWANAASGKYARLDLPERFGVATLPETAAIDLRLDELDPGRWISAPLAEAVSGRLAAGEQALLFLNRRGYAPLTLCRACGVQVGCRTCDARMVEHRFRGRLVCHQCGATRPIPTTCPACGVEGRMTALGPGVERLAEEAAALWPAARIALLSSDVAEGPAGLRARIAAIAAGEADLVIGTQIVSKGHNFPHLTLVGVIDADLGLQGADLRAAEKTFQLVRQVAGRAGRAARPGAALIQTCQPEHPCIRAILSGDDEGFWRAEADLRARAGAPPYGRMAGVVVSGTDEPRVWDAARALARASTPLAHAGATLWGPAAAPIARIRGRHRVRLLVQAPKGVALQPALRAWLAAAPPPPAIRVAVDVDPQSFL